MSNQYKNEEFNTLQRTKDNKEFDLSFIKDNSNGVEYTCLLNNKKSDVLDHNIIFEKEKVTSYLENKLIETNHIIKNNEIFKSEINNLDYKLNKINYKNLNNINNKNTENQSSDCLLNNSLNNNPKEERYYKDKVTHSKFFETPQSKILNQLKLELTNKIPAKEQLNSLISSFLMFNYSNISKYNWQNYSFIIKKLKGLSIIFNKYLNFNANVFNYNSVKVCHDNIVLFLDFDVKLKSRFNRKGCFKSALENKEDLFNDISFEDYNNNRYLENQSKVSKNNALLNKKRLIDIFHVKNDNSNIYKSNVTCNNAKEEKVITNNQSISTENSDDNRSTRHSSPAYLNDILNYNCKLNIEEFQDSANIQLDEAYYGVSNVLKLEDKKVKIKNNNASIWKPDNELSKYKYFLYNQKPDIKEISKADYDQLQLGLYVLEKNNSLNKDCVDKLIKVITDDMTC